MACDRPHLYVAARLEDSCPERILRLLGRRDDDLDSDWFVFSVDLYFNRRSGYKFCFNPAGSIIDAGKSLELVPYGAAGDFFSPREAGNPFGDGRELRAHPGLDG